MLSNDAVEPINSMGRGEMKVERARVSDTANSFSNCNYNNKEDTTNWVLLISSLTDWQNTWVIAEQHLKNGEARYSSLRARTVRSSITSRTISSVFLTQVFINCFCLRNEKYFLKLKTHIGKIKINYSWQQPLIYERIKQKLNDHL